MSFACYVFLIGKNGSYISLGTGPFALGTPPFTGGADRMSVEKPLYPMYQIQIIDTYNVFFFSKSTFPQSRQHIIDSKHKLNFSSFVLFLECLHKRFQNVLYNSLEY